MNDAARSAAASLTMSAKRARTAGDQRPHQRPLRAIVNIEYMQEAYQASSQMPMTAGWWHVSPEGVLAPSINLSVGLPKRA
jgi:hypothetical protein